jgi:two-component system response regulator YesN
VFNILIVEDNQKYREALVTALSTRMPSTAIAEVEDAEEAIENLDDLKPDLMLVDIRLPGMSGLQLTRKIKANHPDIDIIIMTAYDMIEYRQQARQYNVKDFIHKDSTTLEEIIQIVEKYIALKN